MAVKILKSDRPRDYGAHAVQVTESLKGIQEKSMIRGWQARATPR